MTWDVVEGDCVEVMAGFPDASVDSVVCDPPYGLSREPDIAEVLRHWLAGDDYRHRGGGFMGRSWDSFVPGPVYWRECFRVLKPGGYVLAFSSTRTEDLLGIALRLAGFERRDTLAYLFGSGFPKSLDVSKAIDKRAQENDETTRRIAAVAAVIREYRERAGMERAQVSEAVVGTPSGACWNWEHQQLPSVEMWPRIKATLGIPDDFDGLIAGDRARFIAAERAVIGLRARGFVPNGNAVYGEFSGDDRVTAPGTPEAERWEGWGTALKPAHEPIVVARKPLAGTVAGNVLAYGVGAMNIDGCRIGMSDADREQWEAGRRAWADRDDRADEGRKVADVYGTYGPTPRVEAPTGRWPANTILVHSESCRRVGTRRVKASQPATFHRAAAENDGNTSAAYGAESRPEGHVTPGYADVDGMEEVEAWECADGCPVKALDAQSGQSVSQGGTGGFGSGAARRHEGWTRPSHADGYSYTPGYGDSGGASRFFYTAKASSAERNAGLDGFEERDRYKPGGVGGTGGKRSVDAAVNAPPQRNPHPTVKPVAVMRWLVRLVTPPGGLVCDPFTGSGTTGIACALEGFRFIGIERDPEYVPIARARIGWWAEHGEDGLRITREREQREERAATVRQARADGGQLDMFGGSL